MSLQKISAEEYPKVYSWAIEEKLIKPEDQSLIFLSLDQLDDRLMHLQKQFPSVTHAIAIKTNPLIKILQYFLKRGFNLEAASFEEVRLAQHAGAQGKQIVFDSPVKTIEELAYCNEHLSGIVVNANSLSELERLEAFSNLKKGLRVNPMLNTGSPKSLEVSKKNSKFGVPIHQRVAILEAYAKYPDLVGLHAHVGSQIGRPEAMVESVLALFKLAKDIEQDRNIPIEFIDIGGGKPVDYTTSKSDGLEELSAQLKKELSDFPKPYNLITEFGRFVHAECAWALSNIEYILEHTQPSTLLTHLGADLFVREVYSNDKSNFKKYVFKSDSSIEEAKEKGQAYQIAGPLCFAGDYIDRNVYFETPIQVDDRLIIADIGANTFSLWSRHCSRAFPKVIIYSFKQNMISILKEREDFSAIAQFWGG